MNLKLNIASANSIKTFCIFLLLAVIVISPAPLKQFFCHSDCITWVGACFDVTSNSCYVCANSIYKDKDFTNPYNDCVPKDQRKILFKQLDSSGPLSLTGFSTSNPVTSLCSNLTFSGKYVDTDYLEKNFSEITTEHFELVIRFNIGYIGTWSGSDNLQLQINDGVSTTYHTWGYSCGEANAITGVNEAQNLCSVPGTDCVKVKEFVIQHNSSYVNLKWSALTAQNDPNVQNWGIKDLVIAAKTCHRYCDKCFGEAVSQCLTCSSGYFLRGNTCVDKCPKLSILDSRQCVDSCPNGYYHNVLNNFCQPCLSGCSLCSGSTHCLLWDNAVSPAENLWNEKMQLWVVMMVGGVGLLGLVLWKLVIKKYLKNQGQNSSSGSQSPKDDKKSRSSNSGELNQINHTNQNITNQLWIEDVDNIDPVKVDIRRRKKRKADYDQTANNSQTNF